MTQLNLMVFKHKYLKHIHDLHNSRGYVGTDDMTTANLPKIGYIAFLGTQPAACGFLRRVEPCYAQIDTLASHVHYGSQVRHEAIKLIVEALLQDASRLKLKGIICNTSDVGVLNRALSMGFHVVQGVIIAKPL